MKKKQSNKGCVGRRIKVELEKSDTLLQQDDGTVGVGTVIEAGPDAICKIGDKIAFTYWAKDKVSVNEKEAVYILGTDTFVCEIL